MRYLLLSICLLITLNIFAQVNKIKNDPAQENSDLTPPTVYTYVEQLPEPGYDITKYLSEHLNYPDSAFKFGLQGRVILKFIVNEDGSTSDFQVLKSVGGGCDEEAIRVLRGMPKWKPGMHNGLTVRVWFTLPITFTLTNTEMIYTYVEQMPQPRGGYKNMNEYITKHLHYPDSARRKKIGGHVIVRFVVNQDGSISDCKVDKGVGGGCDEEALKVIRSMPLWTPGKQNGKPVRTYFTLSVPFDIDISSAEIAADEKKRKQAIPKRDYDFSQYVEKSLHYPELARKNNIEGIVIIKFGVNEDGIISDCIVGKGIGYGCDEEALRLVRNMPQWTPGVKDGKSTIVYFTQGIVFALKDDRKSQKNKEKAYK